MFVPLTSAACLPLKVFQSVDDKYPFVEVVACEIEIAGVAPPLDAIGAVPVTDVTPVLAMVTEPAPFVTLMPVPAVILAFFQYPAEAS